LGKEKGMMVTLAEIHRGESEINVDHRADLRATEVSFRMKLIIPDGCLRSGAIPSLEHMLATFKLDWEETIQRWQREAS